MSAMDEGEGTTYRTPSSVVARQVATAMKGGQSQLRIEGALDARTVGQMTSVIDAVVADRPRRVTVDIDELTLLDSMGATVIVSLWKRVSAQGGKVVIVHAHDQPLVVLKLLKLDGLLGVRGEREV